MLGGTLEVIIDFKSFRNIDLFDQGIYQLRVNLTCPNSDIIQPYLCLSNNGEQIEDFTFCTKQFEITYSDQYVELENACIFRIIYDAYPNRHTGIKVKVTLMHSLKQTEELKMISVYECTINSACDGLQQGIDAIFDPMHCSTARMYIYTIILDYRFLGKTNFQEFLSNSLSNFEQQKVDDFILNYADSLMTIQQKYKNLLIQIINQLQDKEKSINYQLLMKIPLIQTAKFKTNFQQKSFGDDYLKIVNQLGQSLFQLWNQFQTLLLHIRNYLLEQVDPKIQQNLYKLSQDSCISTQINQLELQQQITPSLLKQREDIWYQARKSQTIKNSLVLMQDNFYGNIPQLPFMFEDVYQSNLQQLQPYNGPRKHLIVLAHGYQGNSLDMQYWRNLLRIKFPNHIILQSSINEENTEGDIVRMSKNLAQEIIQTIKDKVPQKCQLNISMIGHSLGGIILRASLQYLSQYKENMHTYISLASPHIGLGVQQSAVIDAGLWFMKQFKKEDEKVCLNQLTLCDQKSLQDTCLYTLTKNSQLGWFKNAILAFSLQDSYIPFPSSSLTLLENTNSQRQQLHNSMVDNLHQQLPSTVIKTSVFFPNIKNNLDKMIGRAAHIEFIDSHNFIRLFIDYYYDYLC